MTTAGNMRIFRWFFLCWVGVVYLWGIWGGATVTNIGSKQMIVIANDGLKGGAFFSPGDLPRLGLVTLVLVIYGALLWLGLSGGIRRRLAWIYFPLQGGLVLAASLALSQTMIALNLYLALTLAAIVMFKQPRLVVSVALECVGLFLLAAFLEATPLRKSETSPFLWAMALSTLPDYMATILFVSGYILLYLQQMRIQAQLRRAYAELETAHIQHLISAEYIAALTRLTERQRLARELHDTLAQGLTGLLMQMEAIRAGLLFQRYPDVLEMVEQSLDGARTALADARDAIGDLRASEVTPEGLVALVRGEIEATGLEYQAELETLARVPLAMCEQVRRMISEGLTNIVKHARASTIRVVVTPQPAGLDITIEDNGIGFDPASEHTRSGHYGLLGLRERARLIGGRCTLESTPGKGTLLFLQVPLVQTEDDNGDEEVPALARQAETTPQATIPISLARQQERLMMHE
ncbi:MAG TPA: sensor histidine kinase [Ktedonobacteraceae bacterium]|nr:sensor histidine kinase [Ktedonobacteraceae bacterium]